MIFRCGNGASGGKGLVRDGSVRAEFRCVDTIRINKLGANDSGFRNFAHDVDQKPYSFGAPGRNRTCIQAKLSISRSVIRRLTFLNNLCISMGLLICP